MQYYANYVVWMCITADRLYGFLFRYPAKEVRSVTSLLIIFVIYRLYNNIRLLSSRGDVGSIIFIPV
jgi:hypothetical protein